MKTVLTLIVGLLLLTTTACKKNNKKGKVEFEIKLSGGKITAANYSSANSSPSQITGAYGEYVYKHTFIGDESNTVIIGLNIDQTSETEQANIVLYKDGVIVAEATGEETVILKYTTDK